MVGAGRETIGLPIPPACLGATLEMGSNDDVDPERAADQALALLRMPGRGFVDGSGGRPRLTCRATALTAMAQVKSGSPASSPTTVGWAIGSTRGDLVATVIDPLAGRRNCGPRPTGGSSIATASLYAWPGRVIGKIAGEVPLESRTGNLLSD